MHNPFPQELITLVRSAKHIAVLTGAGISAESGVPTFHEAQTGLWTQYDPQELATPQAFRRNRKLVWECYAWRRELVSKANPNAGHLALATLEKKVPKFTLITQNVDGLHERAGSKNVIELHGNIMRTKCFENGRLVQSWPETDEVPPRCPHCDGLLRPDVVWFGENLPYDALETAVSAAQACDIFFSIGTSSLVQPAASLPIEAIQSGAITIEINPQPTPLTPHVNYAITASAGSTLPALITAAFS